MPALFHYRKRRHQPIIVHHNSVIFLSRRPRSSTAAPFRARIRHHEATGRPSVPAMSKWPPWHRQLKQRRSRLPCRPDTPSPTEALHGWRPPLSHPHRRSMRFRRLCAGNRAQKRYQRIVVVAFSAKAIEQKHPREIVNAHAVVQPCSAMPNLYYDNASQPSGCIHRAWDRSVAHLPHNGYFRPVNVDERDFPLPFPQMQLLLGVSPVVHAITFPSACYGSLRPWPVVHNHGASPVVARSQHASANSGSLLLRNIMNAEALVYLRFELRSRSQS